MHPNIAAVAAKYNLTPAQLEQLLVDLFSGNVSALVAALLADLNIVVPAPVPTAVATSPKA